MNLKGLAITVVLLTLMQAHTAADAQANSRAGANRQNSARFDPLHNHCTSDLQPNAKYR